MSMKYCAHWSKFRENLTGTSVRYRLAMLYWYWMLSDVACQDCTFEMNSRRIMGYLRELERAKKIVIPENFKLNLHWDQKITIPSEVEASLS